jgi:hypothetical protein
MDGFPVDFNKWLIFSLFLISAYNYGGLFFYFIQKTGIFSLPAAGFNGALKAVMRLAAGFVIFSTLMFSLFAFQAAGRFSFSAVLFVPIVYQIISSLSKTRRENSELHDNLFSLDFFSALYGGAAKYIRNIAYIPAAHIIMDLLALLILAAAFVSSLPPQYSWDAMAYQLEIPKRYVQHGGLYFIDDIHFAGHPKLLNMLYSFFIMLGRDTLCATLHFTFLLLCYLMIVNFDFKKHIGESFSGVTAKAAALLVITHPQVLILCSWAYIDLGLMFYFTAAALCLISSNYILCAFFMGAAICAKYTGLLIAAIFYLALIYKNGGRLKERLIFSAKMISIPALVFLPYMAANFYFTANPFYPFFGSYIPFETSSYIHLDTYLATLERVGGGRGLIDMLLYPYDSMMNSRVHGNLYYDGIMGMTFFAMLPFFLFALYSANRASGVENRTAALNINAAAAIFVFYYMFVLKAQSTRFFIPAAPLFYIVSAYGLKSSADAFLKAPSAWRKAALMLFTAFLAANAWPAAGAFTGSRPLAYLSGTETRETFLTRNLAPYHCISEFNKIYESLPGVKLMTIYEPRLYYVKSNYMWRDVFEPCELETAVHSYYGDKTAPKTPEGGINFISEKLKEKNITHILSKDRAVEIAARNFDDPVKEALFKKFFGQKTKITASGNGFNLYSINY